MGVGEPDTTGVPNRQGFDDWYGFLNQDHAVDYYTDHLWRNEKKEPIPGNQNGAKGEYTTDRFTREALRFIRVNRWNPFFLYLTYTRRTPISRYPPKADTRTSRGPKATRTTPPWSLIWTAASARCWSC